MQCSNPKKIYVLKNGTEYPLYVPCGKCYACQCASRAEWAIRCKYEMRTAKSVSFVTLTYNNENLPHTCTNRTFKHLLNVEMLKNITERRWDFARLNRDDFSSFMSKMQKALKKMTNDKEKLFRVFASGEYGDITHRPHAHFVIFSPVELNLTDWTNLIKKCWTKGDFNIQVDVNAAIINYVAKHQVKTCLGTPEQQREAPNFKIVSRYLGGIGYNMKNDIDLISRYNNDEMDNFIVNLQNQIEYKIAFPRFLLKHLRNYENLEEFELSNLSHVSRETMEKQVNEILLFRPDLACYSNDGEYLFEETVKNVRKFTRERDNARRREYERKKILKKVHKFTNKLNNFNHVDF